LKIQVKHLLNQNRTIFNAKIATFKWLNIVLRAFINIFLSFKYF